MVGGELIMKRYIKASDNYSISVESFMQRLKDIYHKKFPNSNCLARLHSNDQLITLKPLLCGDVSEVGHSYFGDIADPFDVELDIEFPNTYYTKEISLDTYIDLRDRFCVNIRVFHMETGRLFHEQQIPFPDESVGGIEKEYGRYCGNYESILKLWDQYVDNIYNTLLQLKKENNLPRTILETPSLKAKVNNM